MIFPSDSLFERRRQIVELVDSGKITELEGYREALKADPNDPAPIIFLGEHALSEGNLAEAEPLAREAIRHHPNGYGGYRLLSQVLHKTRPESQLANAYFCLALEKLQFSPDDCEDEELRQQAEQAGLGDRLEELTKAEIADMLLHELEQHLAPESAEETEELAPHRLIQALRTCGPELLDPALVQDILKNAGVCEPLLLGILEEYGTASLTDDDYEVVERALVLLGEIGSLTALPAITEFLTLEFEDLSGPADWAFRRISFQQPVETLAKVRELLPSADSAECIVLAQQVTMMPSVPGRIGALSILEEQFERFPPDQRRGVIFSSIAAYCLLEGAASLRAAQIERKYASLISAEARADLRDFRKDPAVQQPEEASPDELSIFDICCTEPGAEEPAPKKPGRNDACWCGSGKKYKKCHLQQDERA